jgi:hypothetical protein
MQVKRTLSFDYFIFCEEACTQGSEFILINRYLALTAKFAANFSAATN